MSSAKLFVYNNLWYDTLICIPFPCWDNAATLCSLSKVYKNQFWAILHTTSSTNRGGVVSQHLSLNQIQWKEELAQNRLSIGCFMMNWHVLIFCYPKKDTKCYLPYLWMHLLKREREVPVMWKAWLLEWEYENATCLICKMCGLCTC